MSKSFVLLGEFNLETKDPEYDYLVGPREDDLGRISSKEEFIDNWVAAGNDENEGVTYSSSHLSSGVQGIRIDYAFVDESM